MIGARRDGVSDGVWIARVVDNDAEYDTRDIWTSCDAGARNRRRQCEYTYRLEVVGEMCVRNLLSDEGSG
jgi:hypothetical protein